MIIPDTDSTFEEITDTDPEEMPEATDDSFYRWNRVKQKMQMENYQVNIVRGEEFHIELNHEDGQYQPGETVVFAGDMPQGSLIAVGTQKYRQTRQRIQKIYCLSANRGFTKPPGSTSCCHPNCAAISIRRRTATA